MSNSINSIIKSINFIIHLKHSWDFINHNYNKHFISGPNDIKPLVDYDFNEQDSNELTLRVKITIINQCFFIVRFLFIIQI